MTKKKGPTSYTDDPDAHAREHHDTFRRMEQEQYYRDLSQIVDKGLQTDPRHFPARNRRRRCAILRIVSRRPTNGRA